MKTDTIRISEHAQLKTYIPDPEIGYKLYKKRPGIILAPGGAYLIQQPVKKKVWHWNFWQKAIMCFFWNTVSDFLPERQRNRLPESWTQVL